MAKKSLATLEKKDCAASFTIRGTAVLKDNSFSLNAHSNTSDWIYNRSNIGVNCGPKFGTVFVSNMGGYSKDGVNIIRAFGKDEKTGLTDFSIKIEVDWENRFDKAILDQIGDFSFYTADIEKDTNGKIVTRKFLSQYDFVEYLSNNMENGQDYSFAGNVKYQEYNGSVRQTREIKRVYLVEADEEKRHAYFTQTVFCGPDSVVEKDKEKKTVTIQGYVFEVLNKYKGHKLDQYETIPLPFTFEIDMNGEVDRTPMIKKFFMHKSGYNKIGIIFRYFSGGEVIHTSVDDLDEDIKLLVEMGAITEEEALADCAGNTSYENKYIFEKIRISKKTDDDGVTKATPQLELKFYDNEDIDENKFVTMTAVSQDEAEAEKEVAAIFEKEEKKAAKEEKKSDDSDFDLDDLFGDD